MAYRKVKPHPLEKPERNHEVLRYAQEHPLATRADMSKVFGVTAPRITQILKAEKDKIAAAA